MLNEQDPENKTMLQLLEERNKQRRDLLVCLLHIDEWAPLHMNREPLKKKINEFKEMNSHLICPILSEFYDMGEMSSLRQLHYMGKKFRLTLERYQNDIRMNEQEVHYHQGWREVCDQEGGQFYQNDSGLYRFDCPMSWIEEEHDRMRRVHEARERIHDEENLYILWADYQLADVNMAKKKNIELKKKIAARLVALSEEDDSWTELRLALKEADKLVSELIQMHQKVIDHFNYTPPAPIPGIPTFGVTNAYNQRRARMGNTFNPFNVFD